MDDNRFVGGIGKGNDFIWIIILIVVICCLCPGIFGFGIRE